MRWYHILLLIPMVSMCSLMRVRDYPSTLVTSWPCLGITLHLLVLILLSWGHHHTTLPGISMLILLLVLLHPSTTGHYKLLMLMLEVKWLLSWTNNSW
jgi:hypothetical protein